MPSCPIIVSLCTQQRGLSEDNLKIRFIDHHNHPTLWSGRQELNLRPFAPQKTFSFLKRTLKNLTMLGNSINFKLSLGDNVGDISNVKSDRFSLIYISTIKVKAAIQKNKSYV